MNMVETILIILFVLFIQYLIIADEYGQLKKENEQLKSRIVFFEEQEDEFEKYTAQTIQNMIADYKGD